MFFSINVTRLSGTQSAASTAAGMSPLMQLVLALAVLITAAKLGGLISTKLNQPAVLGELLVGIVLGPSVLDLLHLPFFTSPTLAALRERGVRIGVVSDWSSALRPILHHSGLSRYLDFVVGSADSGYAKPLSDLYRLAVDRAQVPAHQIIHIGDSYYADVLGARAVGMDAALIDRHHRAPRTDCRVLHDLRELLE